MVGPEMSQDFAPFSIPTNKMRDLSGDDKAYSTFRKHLINLTFENGSEISGKMGYHHTRAGRAIKPIFRLVTLHQRPLSEDLIEEAKLKGIELHPGQGISFVEPNKTVRSADPNNQSALETFFIDPLIVEYAQSLTSSPATE